MTLAKALFVTSCHLPLAFHNAPNDYIEQKPLPPACAYKHVMSAPLLYKSCQLSVPQEDVTCDETCRVVLRTDAIVPHVIPEGRVFISLPTKGFYICAYDFFNFVSSHLAFFLQ